MGHRAPATRKAMKLDHLEVLVWRAIVAEESDRNTKQKTQKAAGRANECVFR